MLHFSNRWLLVLLIIVLAIAAIGCSKKNTQSTIDKEDLTSQNPNHAEKVDGNGYTLKLVYIGTPQQDELKVEIEASKYLQEKINAKLDITVLDWGSWDNRQNIMIASREEVDVVFTSQWSKHSVNVSKGAFVPLNDLLSQYGQGILESLDPILLKGAQIDGVNYGIPTNKEFAAQGGVIYRKDIAEQLGLDMTAIRSISDMEPIYAAIKEQLPTMTPLFVKHGENLNSHYLGNYDALGDTSIPGYILKDEQDTTVKPLYELGRYLDNLYTARDFYLKGYTNSDAATTQMMVSDALASNEYFSVISPIKPGKANELGIQTGLAGKLDQIALNHKSLATSETAGSMLAISSTSTHQELAMQFINLLHTDEYLINLLNFGIENVHYEKVSPGVIKQTKDTARYSPGSNWMLGNQFLNYLWETEDPNKWEQFKAFNEGAIQSPGLGFVFDGEAVRTEIAAVVNVDKQYLVALETGVVDPDVVLPEYTQKLKVAGIDKVIRAKQKQFDAFLLQQERALQQEVLQGAE